MITLIFTVIAIGTLISKIKIFRIRIGTVAVLLLSFLGGKIIASFYEDSIEKATLICNNLSSLGMALFISVIGLLASSAFSQKPLKTVFKALGSGACVVLTGLVITVICLAADSNINKDIFLGIFCGSMTSTPAMSSAIDLTRNAPSVVLGYGIAYLFGLLFAVLFVCVFAPKEQIEPSPQKSKSIKQYKTPLFPISLSVVCGEILARILPIGSTAGILISSIMTGIFYIKKRDISEAESYKEFGLVLFLISVGIPAGMSFADDIAWRYLIYGALISALSLIIGYLCARFVFRFGTSDALCIVCGGMTSTPAIGALKQSDKNADLSLYTLSYISALFTLLSGMIALFYFI